MNVWVVTFEELNNYSTLVGVYDSQEKARAAAMQYLRDYGVIDIDYDEDETNEYWGDKYSDKAAIIERTKIM